MKAKISSLLLILLVISASAAQQRIDYGESPWGPIDFVWTDLSSRQFSRFENPYTIVAKLTPNEVCVVARVPANSTSAADVARVSTSARDKTFVGQDDAREKDWRGVVFGLVKKGRYEAAKSVVKKMASPAARISAYAHIARAQFARGNRAAARITLLLGLDEVLKEKDESIYLDAYGVEVHEATRDSDWIVILEAMAAVGLDDDIENNLKFVSDSNLPATLLWIGRAQGTARSAGGRGDREAAMATFNRAVQLELTRADATTADSNLVNIIGAQLELGLVNEARQTVLLIKNPASREAAESTIARSTGKPD